MLRPFNKLDIWVWLGTSYTEWGSHTLDKLLFPISLSFLCLTYYISTHNSGWAKGDWNLRVQYLLPYSQVQELIHSFGGVGERKCVQHSELTSGCKLPFNILKLSGRRSGAALHLDSGEYMEMMGAAGRRPWNADTYCRVWEETSYLCVTMSWQCRMREVGSVWGLPCALSTQGVPGCLEGIRVWAATQLLSGLGSIT